MRHLALAGLAIASLLLVVIGLAAFESHVVNVRAHVVDPVSQEIVGCEAQGPDGTWQPCGDLLAVPVGVPLRWTFQIHIHNPLDVALAGVEVTEEFASQAGLWVGPNPGSVTTSYPGSPPHPHLRWHDLSLLPGDSYTLEFEVRTLGSEFVDSIADLVLASGAVMTGSIPSHGDFTATTAPTHIEVLEVPDGLEINTDIDFGIVFPQQIRTDYFKVCLSKTWCGGGQAKTDYKVVLKLKPLSCNRWGCQYYPDLRPYLLVERDPAETSEPAEPDGTAGGLAGPDDYIARGHLDAWTGDKCDKWLVTMKVPVYRGDYNPETDPIPPEEVLVVDIDLEGLDLGADIEIKLDGWWWWWWLWDWWGGH